MSPIAYDTPFLTEVEPHTFEIDASDLGLPPGVWPSVLQTSVGNGLQFVAAHADESAHVYHQQFGCVRLVVVND